RLLVVHVSHPPPLHDALPIFHLFLHLADAPPHEALDREYGVLGVGHGLALGHLADEPLAILREPDDRRRDPPAFGRRVHEGWRADRKSTRLNSSHQIISYAVF